MIVTVSGLSGLTNAYVSVLSATGSLLISGASLWEDIRLLLAVRGRLEQPLDQCLVAVGDLGRPAHHGDLAAVRIADHRDHGLLGRRARRVGDLTVLQRSGCRRRSGSDHRRPRGRTGGSEQLPPAQVLHSWL